MYRRKHRDHPLAVQSRVQSQVQRHDRDGEHVDRAVKNAEELWNETPKRSADALIYGAQERTFSNRLAECWKTRGDALESTFPVLDVIRENTNQRLRLVDD